MNAPMLSFLMPTKGAELDAPVQYYANKSMSSGAHGYTIALPAMKFAQS